MSPDPPRAEQGRGLVAIGDSITRGSGEAMLGLRMQSWALWLAEALGMPYTCLAVSGARASDALRDQVPRLRGEYDLACLYLGVNDVRAPDWQHDTYAKALEGVVAGAVSESRAQLLVKLPPEIGRPPAPSGAIEAANRTIERVAQLHGIPVLDLSSLHGAELVLPDAVHLTARGEAHVALLACRALGMATDERDLQEALEPLRPSARLRYAAGAGAKAELRDWRRRTLERAQGWISTGG
jgi:lysophospholipase L1-like esterase